MAGTSGSKILNRVTATLEHDDAEPPLRNVLLKLQALIGRKQRAEASRVGVIG